MARMSRLSGSILLVAIGVLMSGCGAGRAADEPGPTQNGGGSATSGTPSATAAPAPSTTGSQLPIAKGEVAVTVDAGHYAPGALVRVTVSNRNDRPAYTTDFKTACSIVILQRRDGNAWTDLVGCRLGRPTRIVETGPGQQQRIDIDPHSVHLGGAAGRPAFGAGTYRIAFTYRTEPQPTIGEPMVSYSPEFTIG